MKTGEFAGVIFVEALGTESLFFGLDGVLMLWLLVAVMLLLLLFAIPSKIVRKQSTLFDFPSRFPKSFSFQFVAAFVGGGVAELRRILRTW